LARCDTLNRNDILGAGDGPCVVLAVGAREEHDDVEWGGYPIDELALRHAVGVTEETSDAREAYARLPHRRPVRAAEDWLPG
jgi:hypothetical protein